MSPSPPDAEQVAEALQDGAPPEAREAFRRLDPAGQERALALLKQELDRRVRTRPAEARELAAVMAAVAPPAPHLRVVAVRAQAVAAYFDGRTPEARAAFHEAARLYDEVGDRVEGGKVRRSLVEIELSLGAHEAALAFGDEARERFAEAGREDLLAGLEINVGNVWFRRDDYGRARESYASALARAERLGDAGRTALASFSVANVEMAANRFDEAEAAFLRARDIWEEAGSEALVGDCDYSLAYLESRRGRFGPALLGLERARRRYAEGSKPTGTAYCDLYTADVLFRLHAWRDARRVALRAAAAFEGFEFRFEVARARALASLAAYHLGDHRPALAELAAASEAFDELGNATQVAFLEIQRCKVECAAGRAARVLPRLEEIHAQLEGSGQALLAELSGLALAEALLEAERPDEALARLDRLAGVDASGLTQVETQRLRAEALRAAGCGTDARAALERAVDELEANYSNVPGRDMRIAFLRQRREAYVELAWEVARDGDPRRALALVERSRMRSLTELAPPARLPARFEQARQHLDRLLVQRLDAELGGLGGSFRAGPEPPRPEEVRAAQDELAQAARASWTDAADGAEPGGVEPAFEALAPDEVLVAYFVARRGALALVATRAGVEAVPLPWDGLRVEELADRVEFHVTRLQQAGGDARRAASSRAALDAALEALGEQLVAPLAERLRGRAVVFVPYGPLHGLPLHALRVSSRYLVEEVDVGYAPSLELLARSRRSTATGAAPLLVVDAGDPTLPAARREREAVLAALDGARALAPEGFRERLAGLGRETRALHVLAHGTFEPAHPLFSGMRIGDGFVTAYDVRALDLPLDLVVLSGCETGRSTRVAGEDLSGLREAFFLAGTRAVVGNLWPVLDDEAVEGVALLYERLAAGDTVRAALSAAQRAAIGRGLPPSTWGAALVSGCPDVTLTPHPPGASGGASSATSGTTMHTSPDSTTSE